MALRKHAYWVGFNITCWFPRFIAYLIADTLGLIHYYIIARGSRRNYAANLRVVFPEKNQREIDRITFRAFRVLSRNLADQFRIHRHTPQTMVAHIDIPEEVIARVRSYKGRPVIVATGHLGHWEISASIASAFLGELNSIALPEIYPALDYFYQRARNAIGNNTVILNNATSRTCMRLLKDNRPLAILADRSYTDEGILLDFFGRKALFPTGVAQLAIRFNAVILPYFITRGKGSRFTGHIYDPIPIPPGDDKDAQVETVLKQYIVILEDLVRRYPENWHAFHPVWPPS